jgi:hypothetical protein
MSLYAINTAQPVITLNHKHQLYDNAYARNSDKLQPNSMTGVTVWNTDVSKITKSDLGSTVTITRASVSLYQGKKSLVLSKDSTVSVGSAAPTPVDNWWAQIATQPPLPLPAALVASDNSIINIFGILAYTTAEEKEMNGELRRVYSIHMVSHSAKFQLRGWDLDPSTVEFIEHLKDQVVKVSRIRISSYAEVKVGEILEGPKGTLFEPYTNDELRTFWSE